MTTVKTRHTKPPSQDGHEDRQEPRVPATDRRPDFAWSVLCHRGSSRFGRGPTPRCGVVSHAIKGDTIKLLNDDDDRPKRGALELSQDMSCKTVLFSSFIFLNLSVGETLFRSLDDNGDGACVSSFDETVQMLGHSGVDGALERSCGFCFS